MDNRLPRGLFGFGEGVVFIADATLPIPKRSQMDDFVEKVTRLVAAEVNRFKGSAWAQQVKREAMEFVEILELIVEDQVDEMRAALAEERRRRTLRAVNEARHEIIAQGFATSQNVDAVVYEMPVEQFKRLTAKWPRLSRVDFKYVKD